MKFKSQLKSVFIQPFSCITLSVITTIFISPSVLAVSPQVFWHSRDIVTSQPDFNSTEKQPSPKIAQLSDTDTEQTNRSQLIQQANGLYNDGNLKAAEESFRKFLKKYPEDAFGHFQLGNILLDQKKSEEAISAYQEAIRLKPQYALAYNAIGIAYASQSHWEDAIAQYQKALEINPSYGDALTNFALVYK